MLRGELGAEADAMEMWPPRRSLSGLAAREGAGGVGGRGGACMGELDRTGARSAAWMESSMLASMGTLLAGLLAWTLVAPRARSAPGGGEPSGAPFRLAPI